MRFPASGGLVELEGVTLRRPDRSEPVLSDVSLRLGSGENVALLGANGSGKTTLVHLLNGSLLPESGSVRVDGLDTSDAQNLFDIRRRVGLLFQDPDNQFVTTTAEREIAFGLENLEVPADRIRRQVQETLEAFDLERYRHTPPHEMSGGEKARLALASVWVMGARLLVLDETESLLDRRSNERLAQKLEALPEDTTVLRVTTDAESACASDRVVVLHEGRLIADGSPDDVWPRLRDDVVQRVGSPLVWRLSQRLQSLGRVASPTSSWDVLCQQLQGERREEPRG
jgi:energy-coupling factor transporter ATP-binding protein EcfA2